MLTNANRFEEINEGKFDIILTTYEICIIQDDPSKGQQFAEQTVGRINFSTDKEQSVQSADLVVEAIIENLKIKQDLFEALDAVSTCICTILF